MFSTCKNIFGQDNRSNALQDATVGGVSEGERVVSRGGWEVKLATTAGAIPEHGHQH